MSQLAVANDMMNMGVNNSRSTASQYIPLLHNVLLEQNRLEEAEIAEGFILPECAYNKSKSHEGLDAVVSSCVQKRQELQNAMIKK